MAELKVALLPVTPFAQNCALLWDDATGAGTVIDPGGDVPQILQAIDKLGDQVGLRVEKILLTHGHLDHAGGARALRAALATRGTPAPVIGPDRRELPVISTIEQQGRLFGLSGCESVTPDSWLAEGDVIELGGLRLDVLLCPGHTPGHVVFVEKSVRFAVVGDVLFRGSIGRTDFPYSDGPALLAAIRDKLLPLGDDISFICGHGPGSTFGTERRSNPFLAG